MALAVILLIAWLLGFVGVYTVGAAIHVLLVAMSLIMLYPLLWMLASSLKGVLPLGFPNHRAAFRASAQVGAGKLLQRDLREPRWAGMATPGGGD